MAVSLDIDKGIRRQPWQHCTARTRTTRAILGDQSPSQLSVTDADASAGPAAGGCPTNRSIPSLTSLKYGPNPSSSTATGADSRAPPEP